MNEKTEAYHKAKDIARQCGITGLELRAVINQVSKVTIEQPSSVEVDEAYKKTKEVIKRIIGSYYASNNITH